MPYPSKRSITWYLLQTKTRSSDPSALSVEEAKPPEYSSLTATDQLGIHPALISLSISNMDDSTFHNIPKLVLPVGRLLHGKPEMLLQDILDGITQGMLLDGEVIGAASLGSGTLRTPIKYFENLLGDVPALIKYLELPPSQMSTLTDHFERVLFLKINHDRSYRDDFSYGGGAPVMALQAVYTQKIFDILTGNVQIPQISCETLEKKLRELWHDVMQLSQNFKETDFVAVIDAITPGHPVWIVESSQQKDDDGKYVAHAAQIFSGAEQWLDLYGKSDNDSISWNIAKSLTPYPLVVRTVDLIESREIFSKVGGN